MTTEQFQFGTWYPIESAPKDREIYARSDACKTPLLLRWYKYNGLEAWRDWDADPHSPDIWTPLPPPPASEET